MPTMNPISAAELTALRAEMPVAALDTSCIIRRKTVTSDGMGQGSEAYSTVATVNVGMRPPNATHLANFDYLIGAMSTWLVSFPYGTDVRVQDHLVIGSDTLVVQVDLTPQSIAVLTSVLASEVK